MFRNLGRYPSSIEQKKVPKSWPLARLTIPLSAASKHLERLLEEYFSGSTPFTERCDDNAAASSTNANPRWRNWDEEYQDTDPLFPELIPDSHPPWEQRPGFFFLLYAAWVRSRAERPSVSYTKVVMEVAWTGHKLQFTKTN